MVDESSPSAGGMVSSYIINRFAYSICDKDVKYPKISQINYNPTKFSKSDRLITDVS